LYRQKASTHHGIILNADAAAHPGALGRALPGQGRSARRRLLYPDAGLQVGHAEPARLWPGVRVRTQADLERTGGVGLAAHARWPPTRARRLEPGGPPG